MSRRQFLGFAGSAAAVLGLGLVGCGGLLAPAPLLLVTLPRSTSSNSSPRSTRSGRRSPRPIRRRRASRSRS
ncbi:MAG: twin-arginine translocation signal domain-containing protein [Collinsella sp.]